MIRRAIVLFVLSGCTVAERSAPDLCEELAETQGCSGRETQRLCEDALESAKSEPCSDHVAALAECIAFLDLSCTSPTSISAYGDGIVGGGQNFTEVVGFSVVVNDSECDVHRRGLEACRTCPDAAGAHEVGVRGIGDKCEERIHSDGTESSNCASGAVCYEGSCTRYCQEDDDCMARADGCVLQAQYPNVCVSAQCRRSCGDDYACQAWVGSQSTCVEGACTIP